MDKPTTLILSPNLQVDKISKFINLDFKLFLMIEVVSVIPSTILLLMIMLLGLSICEILFTAIVKF